MLNGYYTSYGYIGFITENKTILFATDSDYREYMMENKENNLETEKVTNES